MPNTIESFRIFVSYSHEDRSFLESFDKHLSTLKREGVVQLWHDRRITAGQTWEAEIEQALAKSDIIVFLLSPDFVASEYCMGKEVAAALQMHERGQAIVIPVIVRPVDWLSTPMAKIQALPAEGKPISSWANTDEAWVGVVAGVRAATNQLKRKRTSTSNASLFVSIQDALVREMERIDDRSHRDDASPIGGASTGLVDLDLVIDGLHAGDLMLISAAPAMDRLALVLPIVADLLVDKQRPGLVFSLRQSKEAIARRLCAAIGLISTRALSRASLQDEDWARLTHAVGKLHDREIGIVDAAILSVEAMIDQVRKYATEHTECALVVIDSLDQITGATKAEVVSQLRRTARELNLPVVVTCGLERDPSTRADRRPILRDLGSWAAVSEDLDIVTLIYQPAHYYQEDADPGLAEIIVTKNPRGELGSIRVTYLIEQQVFKDYLTPEEPKRLPK